MSATSPKVAKKKILIVDDHPFVRQGLRGCIEREPDLSVCGEAACRAEALQLCSGTQPHLVLIDLSLGGESGLDLVKDVSVQFPGLKMLVLSMQDELLYAERVLRAGAGGYVGKSAPWLKRSVVCWTAASMPAKPLNRKLCRLFGETRRVAI